jgi:hypothetical protein
LPIDYCSFPFIRPGNPGLAGNPHLAETAAIPFKALVGEDIVVGHIQEALAFDFIMA